MRFGAWMIDETVLLLMGNIILDPIGTNIDYVIKKITFKVFLNVYSHFLVSRDDAAIFYWVALLEDVVLLLRKTRLVKARWKPLPSGYTFMLNVTYYAVANAMVDLDTLGCVKMMNPSNWFLKMRK